MSRDALRVGAALCLLIVVCARLSLPLAIEPRDVPLPALDPERHAAGVALEAERCARAKREPLSRDVRSVGEFVRRLGALEAERAGPVRDVEALRSAEREYDALQRDATRLCRRLIREQHTESLLALRALQTELFIAAVASAATQPDATELTELGGSFSSYLRQLPSGVPTPKQELAAAYRARWTQLVGLSDHPSFAPSLNDVRQNARLQLRWATRLPVPERSALSNKALEQLAAADPDYPVEFARGVAEYQAGAYAEAFEHFSRHGRVHPDGPWSLRARNHAQAAAALMVQSQ